MCLHFFSILVMHILTCVFDFVYLLVRFSFLKILYNSNKKLYYVITCIIMWKWVHVPPHLTWHIFQIIIDFFGLVMSAYILNQFRGHWLLNNALTFAIHEFKIQRWNWFCNLWQLNGRRWKCCLWIFMFDLQHKKKVVHVFDFFFHS